jgi:hypothetical protein
VIVRVNVPICAGLFAETVNVEVPELGRDAGLNEPLVRLGKPLTLRFTVEVKPVVEATATVYDVLEPRRTVWLLGEAEIVKSATTRVTFAV